MSIQHRRSIRLRNYDYSEAGAYFVTVCTQERESLLGVIVNGNIQSNDAGRMVESVWNDLPARFTHVALDAFVIMPNHIHGILVISDIEGESDGNSKNTHASAKHPVGTLPGTLGRVMQAFKSTTTYEYAIGVKRHGWKPFPGKLWQRNYYEHIIRNEYALDRIREYVAINPQIWQLDKENPQRQGISEFYTWLETSKNGQSRP